MDSSVYYTAHNAFAVRSTTELNYKLHEGNEQAAEHYGNPQQYGDRADQRVRRAPRLFRAISHAGIKSKISPQHITAATCA
jgi:hypothetical protein